MLKVAVLVLADTETLGDLGRIVNALETVKECREAGDDVVMVLDGAATRWIPTLEAADHPYHELYQTVKDRISGACAYCANAFEVTAAVQDAGIPLLDEYDDHPSIRGLMAQGYQIVSF